MEKMIFFQASPKRLKNSNWNIIVLFFTQQFSDARCSRFEHRCILTITASFCKLLVVIFAQNVNSLGRFKDI